ncbi:MAG: hypothetical protein ACI8WT_002315 [Clostridium sp.]|jgi:hypothetical protein
MQILKRLIENFIFKDAREHLNNKYRLMKFLSINNVNYVIFKEELSVVYTQKNS